MEEILKYAAYIISGIIGWFVKTLWIAQKELREDMKKIELNLAENYTKRVDFRDVVGKLEEKMKETTQPLYQKLDRIEKILLNRHHRNSDP